MILRARLLAPCVVGVLTYSATIGTGTAAGPDATVTAKPEAIPLKVLSSAPIADGDYFAWAEPALCDEDANTYFLVVPHWADDQAMVASGKTPPTIRDVLRVSSDGKKRVTFSPKGVSKFANASVLQTIAVAIDRNGGVFMLVWARWPAAVGQPDKNGQFIVAFNRQGEYRSQLEVDWQEILVNRFEVFGSGDFLLLGRRVHPSEARIAILSASGQTLQDVGNWSGRLLEESLPDSPAPSKFDRMTRGSDGRIYITQDDPGVGDVVYAVSPSGQGERIFKLPPTPKDAPLVAWKSADDRFATSYREPGDPERSPWSIVVYSNAADGQGPETTLYGPAPGPLLCYQHQRSRDRFTFLTEGSKIVTMSSP